ncbi:unnamed protein product [Auanema sp. JU1783]|nr:unnamed protein product [Auanema sp. JU1783]
MTGNEQLLFVQTVWRHGDRAPVMTYPLDEHQESAWPNGWGELTTLGMKQQYALGKVLRKRYIDEKYQFISKRYNPKEIYIRSTDVNRTLLSAYSNIAGMFSQGQQGADYPNDENWPNHWTPIPVHTIPTDMDHEGNVFAPCPRANQLDEIIRASDEYVGLIEENKEFLSFLSENTGMNIEMPIVYLINDVLHIEKIYNLTLPTWATDEVIAKLRNLTEFANMYNYGISEPYVPEMIKLRGGPMLKFLVNQLSAKYSCFLKNNEGEGCEWLGPLKYHAYSAHDTTIAALLSTLGDETRVIRGGLPKYTASVAIELWHLGPKEGAALRILFHGAFHHNYHVITHLTKGCPDNNEFCSLKTFIKRSQPFIPKNLEKECVRKEVNNRTTKSFKYI